MELRDFINDLEEMRTKGGVDKGRIDFLKKKATNLKEQKYISYILQGIRDSSISLKEGINLLKKLEVSSLCVA